MRHGHAVTIGVGERFRGTVRDALEAAGLETVSVADGEAGRRELMRATPAVLVVEVGPEAPDPGSLLETLREADRDAGAVVIGVVPADSRAPAARLDAELVPESADDAWVRYAIERASARRAARSIGKGRPGAGPGSLIEPRLVGHSRFIDNLRRRIDALAQVDGSVLFSGEAGVGKQLAARTVHRRSARAAGPFRVLYCSALEDSALRRELLDGAAALEAARGGVLYLDEVGALPPAVQPELAARLETLAGTGAVRVLCGSTMDLHRAAEEGRFREDLLRHVAGSTVRIEPLRARIEDVALLASYFVRRIAEVNELPDIRLMPDAVDVLVAYRWPGNVRELQNAIEHAAILALDGRVRPRDLPDRVRRASEDQIPREGPTGSSTFRDAKRKTVEAFERRYLEDLMKRNRGNVTAASEQAGMLRSALQRLLRKHRMPSSKFRGPSS